MHLQKLNYYSDIEVLDNEVLENNEEPVDRLTTARYSLDRLLMPPEARVGGFALLTRVFSCACADVYLYRC